MSGPIYSEVDDVINMHENECYHGITDVPELMADKKQKDSCNTSKTAIIVLFAVVLALLLGTVGACIAFALEIFNLSTELSQSDSRIQQLNTSHSTQLSVLDNRSQQLSISISTVISGSGKHAGVPVVSCAALPPSSSSGYYWVRSIIGSVRVYCDMTRSCGGVSGGWMRGDPAW